jgi:hypothetical protein
MKIWLRTMVKRGVENWEILNLAYLLLEEIVN